MNIILQVRSTGLRQWHYDMASRLGGIPEVNVSFDWRPVVAPPRGLELLMALEALISPGPRRSLAKLVEQKSSTPNVDKRLTDLIISMDALPESTCDCSCWHLAFDGLVGEAALISALLRRDPVIATLNESRGTVIASGRPGSESGHSFTAALEDNLARLITLVVSAVKGAAFQLPFDLLSGGTGKRTPTVAFAALRSIEEEIVRRLYKLCFNAPHWKVGWRADSLADLVKDKSTEGSPWNVLQDDGRRFYADPFLFSFQGTMTMFVEEFPHQTKKGIISVAKIGRNGPEERPVPVLEAATHLSYPHVFSHDGSVWMVPESSTGNRVDLYRADPFPTKWTKITTLVDGVCASDATLTQHGGRWWMFATVRDDGGAFSDTLCIWLSSRLEGPWRPHRRNPVLIDTASARPAGQFIWQNGMLIRPVQDCRKGYGAALNLAQIVELDEERFLQTTLPVRQGRYWPGRLHTYNKCGVIEVIDGSKRALKRPCL